MGKLEDTLAQGVKDGKIPHAVVYATNKNGSFTYEHSVGKRNYPQDEPVQQDAEFLLASQSKLLTTIAALQVVEQGLVTLDEDVSGKLPDLGKQPIIKGFDENDKPILENRKNPITLRQLLTHTAGATYDLGDENLIKWRHQQGREPNTGVTVAEKFGTPLTYQPGTSFFYSTGIDWAGKLVEVLTGSTLEDYMQKHMWQPLGTKTLTFWPYKHAELKDKVPGLTTRTPDGGLAPFTYPFINTGSTDCFGGHGLYGTMEDYIKVQRSILANNGKLLKPETVEMMFQPQLNADGRKGLQAFRASPFAAMIVGEWAPDLELDWGLGGILLMSSDKGRRKKGTLSWGGMANTFWLIDREADLALTFGTQVSPPGDEKVSEMISAVEYGVYEMAGVKI